MKYTINNVSFKMTGDSYSLSTFPGIVYTAILCDGIYNWNQVNTALLHHKWENQIIRGVEMFACIQQTNRPIGILVDKTRIEKDKK